MKLTKKNVMAEINRKYSKAGARFYVNFLRGYKDKEVIPYNIILDMISGKEKEKVSVLRIEAKDLETAENMRKAAEALEATNDALVEAEAKEPVVIDDNIMLERFARLEAQLNDLKVMMKGAALTYRTREFPEFEDMFKAKTRDADFNFVAHGLLRAISEKLNLPIEKVNGKGRWSRKRVDSFRAEAFYSVIRMVKADEDLSTLYRTRNSVNGNFIKKFLK